MTGPWAAHGQHSQARSWPMSSLDSGQHMASPVMSGTWPWPSGMAWPYHAHGQLTRRPAYQPMATPTWPMSGTRLAQPGTWPDKPSPWPANGHDSQAEPMARPDQHMVGTWSAHLSLWPARGQPSPAYDRPVARTALPMASTWPAHPEP
jgi:hypothetical protein